MKILLIGEYSRSHNSLKEGLIKLGHEVLLVASGDGFKNYPADILIQPQLFGTSSFSLIVKAFYFLFKINLIELENAFRFNKIISQLKGFDIAQLINENSLRTHPKLEVRLLKKIIQQNKKLFLLSGGTDYISVKYAHDKKFKYSILTPLHNDSELKKHYTYIMRYLTPQYVKLHEFIFQNINGVIASDFDYHIPLKNHPKYLGLVPNSINIDKLPYLPLEIKGKIKIFHGINRTNFIKKGNIHFNKALNMIKEKYSDKIDITITYDVPYDEYIKIYNDCHILLDQVYAYDQGYNALEAMAQGKVVFTGAESQWLKHYNLEENSVAINALPNHYEIFDNLEWLILNPEKIIEISRNARNFIEREHNYIKSAQQYLNLWNSN